MKKKLYVLLCMVLGLALMLIIQRSGVAIYTIVSDSYPAYDLLTITQFQVANWTTLTLAILVGLVYGNFLGHHWYPLVYKEENSDQNIKANVSKSQEDMRQKTVTIKPVRAVPAKVKLRSEVRNQSWDFDDLLNRDAPAVDSMASSGPTVASAISLGEISPKTKTVVKRSAKTVAAKNISVKDKSGKTAKPAVKKTAAKAAAKSVVKNRVKKTAIKVKT